MKQPRKQRECVIGLCPTTSDWKTADGVVTAPKPHIRQGQGAVHAVEAGPDHRDAAVSSLAFLRCPFSARARRSIYLPELSRPGGHQLASRTGHPTDGGGAQGMGPPDSTQVLTQSSLREPSRLGHEVILFRDARCPACRNSVVFDGALIIADHF